MFSVYDYGGRVFRDTLEELYKVYPIEKAAVAQSKHDESDINTAIDTQFASFTPQNSALESYKSLIHADVNEELHHAYEIMQKAAKIIDENSTIYHGLNILKSGELDILPVVNHDQRVVGLFSYQKVVNEVFLQSEEPVNIKLLRINTLQQDPVITAEPITSIRRVADVMFRYKLAVIPILDSYQNLVGIISWKDIVGALAKDPPLSVWS